MDPQCVSARLQSLHHFVAPAPREDRALLRIADRAVLDQMDRHGGVMAWSLDDTWIPNKETHSVGVARQYCGNLGKQDNCQVALSLSLVSEAVGVPATYRLYPTKGGTTDRRRRKGAGVPSEIRLQTKWEIALEEIDTLRTEGPSEGPIVADAGYRPAMEIREGVTHRGLPYVMGIQCTVTLWEPCREPLRPAW